jgi:hypothetical protein
VKDLVGDSDDDMDGGLPAALPASLPGALLATTHAIAWVGLPGQSHGGGLLQG